MSAQLPEGSNAETANVLLTKIDLEGRYVLDDPENEVIVPMGNGILMHYVMAKAELEDYTLREQMVKRESSVNKDRVVTPENDETDANTNFFNSLALRGYATKAEVNSEGVEEHVTIREYMDSELKRFTFENKDEVVSVMNESDFDVVDHEGKVVTDPLAGLTEIDGPMYIRQIIGGEDNPLFKPLFYAIQAPGRELRRTYLKDSFKVERKTEKKRVNLKTIFDINKGVGVFNTVFRGLRGAVIGNELSDNAQQSELLKLIDCMWRVGVVDAACAFFASPKK
jgi:hypothetical protein